MVQGCSGWTDTLSNLLDNCPQLHTLDVSSLQSAVTDSFLADVCEKAIELRCLGLYLGPHKPLGPRKTVGPAKPISSDLLTAVVRVCPSLAQLWLTVSTEGGKMSTADGDVVDMVVEAVRQDHAGLCNRRDVSLSSGSCHQIQLTFTPLKLLTALASCPYLGLAHTFCVAS